MDERLRFVARLLDGESMSEVCREFGISRKTGYKIFTRYKDQGLEALRQREPLTTLHGQIRPFRLPPRPQSRSLQRLIQYAFTACSIDAFKWCGPHSRDAFNWRPSARDRRDSLLNHQMVRRGNLARRSRCQLDVRVAWPVASLFVRSGAPWAHGCHRAVIRSPRVDAGRSIEELRSRLWNQRTSLVTLRALGFH
jgi:transposase-like protein